MKYFIYSIIVVLFAGCSDFLEDYSQDLVIPKTVSDLNEVILGSGYLPSSEVKDLARGTVGWWLHILDDDVNTVIMHTANTSNEYVYLNTTYYGYYTWQYEVGRDYDQKIYPEIMPCGMSYIVA